MDFCIDYPSVGRGFHLLPLSLSPLFLLSYSPSVSLPLSLSPRSLRAKKLSLALALSGARPRARARARSLFYLIGGILRAPAPLCAFFLFLLVLSARSSSFRRGRRRRRLSLRPPAAAPLSLSLHPRLSSLFRLSSFLDLFVIGIRSIN